MQADSAVWLVLVISPLAANAPFLNERLMLVGPRRSPKSLGWRLIELLLLGLLSIGLGVALEARLGQWHRQSWEFYAAFGCLFFVLAFPGFVWRYLRKGAS